MGRIAPRNWPGTESEQGRFQLRKTAKELTIERVLVIIDIRFCADKRTIRRSTIDSSTRPCTIVYIDRIEDKKLTVVNKFPRSCRPARVNTKNEIRTLGG